LYRGDEDEGKTAEEEMRIRWGGGGVVEETVFCI